MSEPAVRPSALPQPLQPARRRQQDPGPGRAGQGAGHARAGADRSRQPLRRRRVPPRGEGGRLQADRRARGLRRPRPAHRPRPAAASSGQEHAFHLTLLARNGEGVPQPDAALVALVPGRVLLQAADRQGDPRAARRGADLPLGLRLGRVLRLHPPRQDGRGRAALRLVSEGLRRGELLRRDPEQRRRHPARLRRRGASTSPGGWACRWSPPATPTT